MSVPDYQSLSFGRALADGVEVPISEVRARIAAAEGLTPDDLREMLPSGRQPVFANRVGLGGHLHDTCRSAGTGPSCRLSADG